MQKELTDYIFTNEEIRSPIQKIFENEESTKKVLHKILIHNKYQDRYLDIIWSQPSLPQKFTDFSLQEIEHCADKSFGDPNRKFNQQYSTETRKLSTILLSDLVANNHITSGIPLKLLAFMNNDPNLSFDDRYKLIHKVINDTNVYINQYKNEPITVKMLLDLGYFIDSLNEINQETYKSLGVNSVSQDTKNILLRLKDFTYQIETRLMGELDNENINPYILGCLIKICRMQYLLDMLLWRESENIELEYTKKIASLPDLFRQLKFSSKQHQARHQYRFVFKSLALEPDLIWTDTFLFVFYENSIKIVEQIRKCINKDIVQQMDCSYLSYPFLYFDISEIKDYLKQNPHYLVIKDLMLDYRKKMKTISHATIMPCVKSIYFKNYTPLDISFITTKIMLLLNIS